MPDRSLSQLQGSSGHSTYRRGLKLGLLDCRYLFALVATLSIAAPANANFFDSFSDFPQSVNYSDFASSSSTEISNSLPLGSRRIEVCDCFFGPSNAEVRADINLDNSGDFSFSAPEESLDQQFRIRWGWDSVSEVDLTRGGTADAFELIITGHEFGSFNNTEWSIELRGVSGRIADSFLPTKMPSVQTPTALRVLIPFESFFILTPAPDVPDFSRIARITLEAKFENRNNNVSARIASFGVVPEPTTGTMLMLGLCLLARSESRSRAGRS